MIFNFYDCFLFPCNSTFKQGSLELQRHRNAFIIYYYITTAKKLQNLSHNFN